MYLFTKKSYKLHTNSYSYQLSWTEAEHRCGQWILQCKPKHRGCGSQCRPTSRYQRQVSECALECQGCDSKGHLISIDSWEEMRLWFAPRAFCYMGRHCEIQPWFILKEAFIIYIGLVHLPVFNTFTRLS